MRHELPQRALKETSKKRSHFGLDWSAVTGDLAGSWIWQKTPPVPISDVQSG